MPINVSATFRAMAQSSNQRWAGSAEVWNGSTKLATLTTVTAGSVTVTATAEVRRTCTVTLESQGRLKDSLVPVYESDLLHPSSGNELRLFRGFRYASGISETCPLGVFRMSNPQITDTDSGIAITITGNDRSKWISRQAWTSPLTISAGTNLATALKAIINPRLPNALYNFPPTSITLALTTLGATIAGTNDPWADAQALAAAEGMMLFFDPNGICTLTPVPTPAATPVSWVYAEGENVRVPPINRALDATETFNGVVVVGDGQASSPTPTPTYPTTATQKKPLAPVTAETWTQNPASPVRVTNPAWGYVPKIIQTTTLPADGQTQEEAQAAAQAMADAEFPLVCTALDVITFACPPNGALVEGDALRLVRPQLGISNTYIVSGLTIPLGPGDGTDATPEVVVLRPLSEAQT